ncbi:hypothetical protein B0D78_12180, partial [Pyramidobacter sp. C12-8]
NNSSTVINNVEAKFKIADAGTGTKTITADKTGTEIITFAGDGNLIESEVGTAGVKHKVNTANLNTAINNQIANNTTVQNLAGGFKVKAGANEGPIVAGNTLEFAGKNYVEAEYDSTAKKMTIGLDDATKNKIDNLSTTINNASKWTIKDGETPAGEKEINSTTPLVVKGENGVTTKVDAGGLTIGLNGANLSNTINNSSTVINNVEAKFKIADAGTGTKTITADKTGTEIITFAGDGNIIESEVGTSGVKYKVNAANLNTAINNQIANNTTVQNLAGGFTVSNEAGTKQDITLGGATKKNIKFAGETGKIDVTVAADGSDGAKVTVSANPNLGQNIDISNNSAITTITGTLSGGLNFAGNDGAVNRTLGQTLNLKGGLASVTSGASGKNLGVKKNAAGDGFDLVMSETPEFASVTVKSGANEIKLNGATGTIAGLSNTTLDAGWGENARAGQAATEGQLKAAALAAGQNATYTIGAAPHGSAPGILLDSAHKRLDIIPT